jgi:hypothetical protein
VHGSIQGPGPRSARVRALTTALPRAGTGPTAVMHRDKQRVLLPVLGGVCYEENVAIGAIDMSTTPFFKDHAEFQGFLLHNGAPPRPPCAAPVATRRGLRMHAGMFAPRSSSRVHTVMAWLQQCIMERRREGGLQVAPPLLTRMYQLLSDGMLGYEQCMCAPTPHMHVPAPLARYAALPEARVCPSLHIVQAWCMPCACMRHA